MRQRDRETAACLHCHSVWGQDRRHINGTDGLNWKTLVSWGLPHLVLFSLCDSDVSREGLCRQIGSLHPQQLQSFEQPLLGEGG